MKIDKKNFKLAFLNQNRKMESKIQISSVTNSFQKVLLNFFYGYRIISYTILLYIIVYNLLNAYNLGINAHDYGISIGTAKNALFNGNYYSDVQNHNFLGEHFSPILILFGIPLIVGYHPIIVLVIQSIIMLSALLGIFKIYYLWTKNSKLSEFLTLLLIPNTYFLEIFKHDFHIEIIGFTALIYLIYYINKFNNNNIIIIFLAIIILLVKEDTSLVLFSYFLLLYLKNTLSKKYLYLSIFSALYFLLCFFVLMPLFADGKYIHIIRYQALGDSPLNIITNLLSNPELIIRNLKFESINNLFKSFYYFPLLFITDLFPAFIPIIYNNLSDYYFQNNFLWIHSYMILPFIFNSGAKSIDFLLTFWNKINLNNLFLNKIYINIKLFLDRLINFNSEQKKTQIFNASNFYLLLISFIILMFYVPKITFLFRENYVLGHLISKTTKDKEIVKILYSKIKPIIGQNSSIASVGELQPHLLQNQYSGFLGIPSTDSISLKKANFLIFLEDRIPWPFTDSTNYSNYKNERLLNFTPIYKDSNFLILKKKK